MFKIKCFITYSQFKDSYKTLYVYVLLFFFYENSLIAKDTQFRL